MESNNKKKILIIDLGKAYGGMEKFIENLILGYKGIYNVTLAINSCGEFVEKSNVLDQCNLLKFDNNIKTFIKTIYKIVKYVKEEDIKIVHCNGTPSNIIGIILKKILGVRVVSTIHSDTEYEFEGLKKNIYLIVEKLTTKYLDFVVGVSKDLKEKLQLRHNKYSDKIKLIYNGINFELESEKSENTRTKFKFIFVGRLVDIKNVPLLIRALYNLKQNNKEFVCDIIGCGEEEEQIKALVEKLNLNQYINFLGYKENINEQMLESDAFVMTSKMEGIPITILEAFSSKLPVIASAVGGINEMIVSGENGILFESSNENQLSTILNDVIDNKYDLNKIRQTAYEDYRNNWTREIMTSKYKELYETKL